MRAAMLATLVGVAVLAAALLQQRRTPGPKPWDAAERGGASDQADVAEVAEQLTADLDAVLHEQAAGDQDQDSIAAE